MRLHLTLFIAGILTALGLPALPPPVMVCVIALAVASAVAFKPTRGPGLLGVAAVRSVAHMTAGINAAIPSGAEGEIGYVDSFPLQRERSIGFQLAVRHLDIGASRVTTPRRIQLAWFGPEAAPQLGSRCEFYVRLKRPHGFVNPGGFDKERHLLAQRTFGGATGRFPAHGHGTPAGHFRVAHRPGCSLDILLAAPSLWPRDGASPAAHGVPSGAAGGAGRGLRVRGACRVCVAHMTRCCRSPSPH